MLDVILSYRILYGKSIAATHFSQQQKYPYRCMEFLLSVIGSKNPLVSPRTGDTENQSTITFNIETYCTADKSRFNYWIYNVKTHKTSYFWILWDESYYGHTLRMYITNPIFTKSLGAEDRWEAELDLLLAFFPENSWDEPQDRRSHPVSPAEPDTRLLETI